MRGVTAPLKPADWVFIWLASELACFLDSKKEGKKNPKAAFDNFGRRELWLSLSCATYSGDGTPSKHAEPEHPVGP